MCQRLAWLFRRNKARWHREATSPTQSQPPIITGGNLPNVTLTVDIPEGATFISADGTFVINGNQVTWDLGTLGPGANEDAT